jgi:putative transposase
MERPIIQTTRKILRRILRVAPGIIAWVFMPEHLHLMILPCMEIYSISDILKSIKQPVARRMIGLLKKKNPGALKFLDTGLERPRYRFWQDGGGYDRNYWSTDEVIKKVNYIHRNPVARGLVEHECDWKWSSAREWTMGEKGCVPVELEVVNMM